MKIFKLPKILISLLLLMVIKNNNFSMVNLKKNNQFIKKNNNNNNDNHMKKFFTKDYIKVISFLLGSFSSVVYMETKKYNKKGPLQYIKPLIQEVAQLPQILQVEISKIEEAAPLVEEPKIEMSEKEIAELINLNDSLKNCKRERGYQFNNKKTNEQYEFQWTNGTLIDEIMENKKCYTTIREVIGKIHNNYNYAPAYETRQESIQKICSKKKYDPSDLDDRSMITKYEMFIRNFFYKNYKNKNDYNKLEILNKTKFGLLCKVINDDKLMKIPKFKKWVDDLILFIKENQKVESLNLNKITLIKDLKYIVDSSKIYKVLDDDTENEITKIMDTDFNILKFIINFSIIFNITAYDRMGVAIMNDNNEKFAEEVLNITTSEDENTDDFINKVIKSSLNNFEQKYKK